MDSDALNDVEIQSNSCSDHFLFALITTMLGKHHGKNPGFGTRRTWVQIPASHINPKETIQIPEGPALASVSPFIRQRYCPPNMLWEKLLTHSKHPINGSYSSYVCGTLVGFNIKLVGWEIIIKIS